MLRAEGRRRSWPGEAGWLREPASASGAAGVSRARRRVADDLIGGAAPGGRRLRGRLLPVLPLGPVPRAGHRRGVDVLPGRYVLPGGNVRARRQVLTSRYVLTGRYVLAAGYVLARRLVLARGNVLAGRYLLAGGYLLAWRYVRAGRQVLAARGRGLAVDGRRVPVLAGPLVTGPVVSGPVIAAVPFLARLPGRHPRQLQRGPLVLRHDRRRVDGGRRVVPRRRRHRLVGRRDRDRVTVGHRAGPGGRRELALLVGVGGLGAGDQLDVGPQVVAADLDDVVGLLAERPGDGPVSVHRDVHQRDPHAEILDIGDDLGQVLLGADDERVADRVVARQRGQVAVDLGLHALAPAGADLGHAELDARHVGQRVLLGGAAPVRRGLVPVAAEHRQAGALAGQAGQQLQESLVVPGDRFAPASSVHSHSTIRKHVASVDEQRAAIHGPTVLSSAQRPSF